MISLNNVSKKYKLGIGTIEALKNINLTFREKEFITILGPSGCGKTTLLNVIGGLDAISSGKLMIDNIDTSTFNTESWDVYRNQSIGFVFQTYYLIKHINIFENIEMPLLLSGMERNKRREKVLAVLERVGLSDQAYKKPNQLSGGQLQRAAIARALINDPKIILADEPTGALDSKNAIQIMQLLKDISKEHLVIIVTHNNELSKKYATRVIELLDGEIVNDSDKSEQSADEAVYKDKKTSMPFLYALKLSFKNLIAKRLRTTMIIIAGCIGIIAVTLVLSASKGINNYMVELQRAALGNYPVEITSSINVTAINANEDLITAFPDSDRVTILKGITQYPTVNQMDNNLMLYLENIDEKLYSAINYSKSIKMNLISKNDDVYKKVIQSEFREILANEAFVREQYDVLSGTFPSKYDEVALLIDKYNRIDVMTLDYLGIEYTSVDEYKIEDLLGIEFKLIDNNDFYIKRENGIYQTVSASQASYKELYESAKVTLKITAIVRVSKDSYTDIYSSGVLYTPQLTQLILENAAKSEIVVDQLSYGYDMDVLTGNPYSDTDGITTVYQKDYHYENRMYDLGMRAKATRVYVYTDNFENRLLIRDYIRSYQNDNENIRISYRDYLENITTEMTGMVNTFVVAAIIFASISLIVSGIMIAVLTYVSVIERTSEIGILRSIGARKIDIFSVFTSECMIIGFSSGVIGVIGSVLVTNPVNKFIKNFIVTNGYSIMRIVDTNVVPFAIEYAALAVAGSIVITVIAGLIPSIIAARKQPVDALRSN